MLHIAAAHRRVLQKVMPSMMFFLVLASTVVSVVAPLSPDPRIVALLQQADADPRNVAIVSIEQAIIAILLSTGLAWNGRRIASKHVGVHKSNRYGFGVSWSRFHRLGQKIMNIGFSWNACSNIICVEGSGDSDSADFTLKLQESAAGFGKQRRHELQYFSLGGGHLNQLFVAFDDAVPCSSNRISTDGRMSWLGVFGCTTEAIIMLNMILS